MEEKKAEEALEIKSGEIPAPLKIIADESMKIFLSLRDSGNWTVSKQADGVIISFRQHPEKDLYIWKVESSPIFGPREDIYE